MGLSDNPDKPRKQRFPDGVTIAPGQYMVVYLSGLNTTACESARLCHANFSLMADGYEELVLSTPAGVIVDRVSLPAQYSNISYGRISGRQGFFCFAEPAAMAVNASGGYASRALPCEYPVEGGRGEQDQQQAVHRADEPPTFFDNYCTFMGPMMATESVIADIEARCNAPQPEMARHLARWNLSESKYNSNVGKIVSDAETWPGGLLGYMQESYGLSDEQMQHYFGDAIAKWRNTTRPKAAEEVTDFAGYEARQPARAA